MMVRSATTTFSAGSCSQDAVQSHSHPAVDRPEGRLVAVFEVTKPVVQDLVEFHDSHQQARSTGPRRLKPDSLFELIQAFLPWPTHPALEMIPEKIKPALLCRIDKSRFLRMERQSFRFHLATHPRQCPFRFFLATTKNHEVVRIPHHRESLPRCLVVQ